MCGTGRRRARRENKETRFLQENGFLYFSGQQNDQRRALGVQAFERGQRLIERDQIGRVRFKRGQRGFAIRCRVNAKTIASQIQFQDLDLRLVVHDKNPLVGHCVFRLYAQILALGQQNS
jgi:hypothetical protein